MKRLLDKVALITGGNTGIGRGVALAFADEGADVAVAYHGHLAEARRLPVKLSRGDVAVFSSTSKSPAKRKSRR